MALFYASSVMSLLRLPRWLGRLSLLGTIGRLSLSNYLLVSLLGTTVFYSYALGFRGKMSPGQVLIFGILAYAGLGAFSRWWSGHYRLGPMEWVWRRLSYGSPAAMGSR